MKSPVGGGVHSRTAKDDALVNKQKKNNTGSLACKFYV